MFYSFWFSSRCKARSYMKLSARMKRSIALGAVLLACGAFAGEVRAQMTPPPGPIGNWVRIEDSVWISRIVGHDTLDPLEIAQGYVVEMLGDSTCATRYTWADCRINNTAWRFHKWHGSSKRGVSTAANLLSWNTRTTPVTLHAGDTISFYRALEWYNPQGHTQQAEGYISHDTLCYSIEMIRAADSARILKLDSMGVMPSLSPGMPVIHGGRPIMALVTFVVPPSLNNTTAYLRLHLYDRGNGDYFFERYDRVRLAPRRSLTSPEWLYYLQTWGVMSGSAAKQVLDVSPASGEGRLDVRNDHGRLEISFTRSPDGRSTGVAVFDLQGRLLFYPYLSPSGSTDGGEESVTYSPEGAGVYIVGLLHGGTLVRTQKITLTR